MTTGSLNIIVHDNNLRPRFLAGAFVGFAFTFTALTGCIVGEEDSETAASDDIEVADLDDAETLAAAGTSVSMATSVCFCTCGDPPFKADHGDVPRADGTCPLQGTVCNPEAALPQYRRNWECQVVTVPPVPPSEADFAAPAQVN